MSYLNQITPLIETFTQEANGWQTIGLEQDATEFSLFHKETKRAVLIEAIEDTVELRFVYPHTTDAMAKKILEHRDPVSLELQGYTVLVSKKEGACAFYQLASDEQFSPLSEDISSFIDTGFVILDGVLEKLKKPKSSTSSDTSETSKTPSQRPKKPTPSPSRSVPSVKETSPSDNDSEDVSPLAIIRQYFKTKKFKHKERTSDSGQKSFVFGVRTENYEDSDGDKSIMMVISIQDNGKLIRLDAPNCYNIYKGIEENNPEEAFLRYQKSANLIVHNQYEYKLVKYWLDPNDGEMRMRFDFPLQSGQLDFSQINRQVNSLVQIADDAHEKFVQYIFDADDDLFENEIFNAERVKGQRESLLSKVTDDERLTELSVEQLQAWQEKALAALTEVEQSDNTGI